MRLLYLTYATCLPSVLTVSHTHAIGVARASAKTDENGHDVLYALPILNNEFKADIPCQCNYQRYDYVFVLPIVLELT